MSPSRAPHPHDVALLHDLVDERLSPAAADDLRRRLADEPDLAAAHGELLRMRAAVAAMPAPVEVPSDFLARVRARAGLPPSEPVAATPAAATNVAATRVAATNGAATNGAATNAAARPASPAADAAGRPPTATAAADAGPASSPASGRGRVLSFSRFAVPLAAGLGLLLGGGLYLATRFDRSTTATSSARHAPTDGKHAATAEDPLRARDDGTWTPAEGARTEDHAGPGAPASAGAPVSGGTVPPAGAIAPPAGPPRAEGPAIAAGGGGAGATGAPRYRAPGGAVPEGLREPRDAAAAPRPTAPPAPIVPPGAPAPRTDTGGGDPEAPASEDGASRPATPPAEGVPDGRGLAYGARNAPPPDPVESLRAGLLRAEEGVDEVVVVRAGSVDEVRAALAVLGLAPTRAGAPRPVLDVVAPDVALAAPRADARAGAGALPADRGDDDGGALGSFVAELTPAAYAELTATLPLARALGPHEMHDGDDGPRADEAEGSDGPRTADGPDAPAAKPGRAGDASPRPGADAPAATKPKQAEAGAKGDAAPTSPPPAPDREPAGTDKARGTEKSAAGGAPAGPPKLGGRRGTPAAPPAPPPASVPPAPAPTTPSPAEPAAPGASKDAGTAGAAAAVRRVRIVVLPR